MPKLRSYGKVSVSIVTAAAMNFVGIILPSGGLLPEKTDPIPVVPGWPEFMRGCVTYRQSLDEQAPKAPRTNEPYEK